MKMIKHAGLRLIPYWLVVMLLMIPSQVYGQSKQVNVKIAEFSVTVNGIAADNANAAYPLFVYKDITYFPLTWDMSKALKWDISWSEENGLKVSSVNERTVSTVAPKALHPDAASPNSTKRSYLATVVDYPVELGTPSETGLGGWELIDQSKEPYPLLQFRDMTYIPLTWHIGHELLGLSLAWNEQSGLQVTSLQYPELGRIFSDDADSLYVLQGGQLSRQMFRVDKKLEAKPVALSRSEWTTVMDASSNKRDNGSLDVSAEVTKQDDMLMFRGNKINVNHDLPVDATLWTTQNNVHIEAKWFPLEGDQGLLSLRMEFVPPIAVPHELPFRALLYWVHGQEVTELPGYMSVPDRVIANSNGSHWIYTSIRRGYEYRAYNYHHGQAALLAKDGTFKLVNNMFEGKDVNVLGADNPNPVQLAAEDGSLMIDVFQPSQPIAKPSEGGTLFRLTTELLADKVSNYDQGYWYMGINRHLYFLDSNQNSITNVTEHRSAKWWDYELEPGTN
ncbi:hypothetical protein [Paenibacillus sp. N3.4]|uniref:hypothetical protein n=1 Tax=Paenibacillus sp. N3.4 TaxID=2603222 RepID=UPI0011C90481|nr:hypothetical protein [Paenibacillus sp. N3.4]TXK84354.1 hypothetical protein FU659_08960 [Paenibacillus sp. N3.4]